jgi:K+-transporting ATPase ATPase C chain
MLRALRISIVLLVICGGIYPAVVTGLGQAIFPHQANGSIIEGKSGPVGSELIGQAFDKQGYFHPRPSAAGPDGYDASLSGGSNLGPTNGVLINAVRDRTEAYREENGLDPGVQVPADAVTASASGLDPDISVENALLQVHRIAVARNLTDAQVKAVVTKNTTGKALGIFGVAR